MSYLAFKHLHVTFVVLSGLGFVLRGCWMLLDSPRLRERWVRVAPHVIDTGLLASAIALAIISGQYPFARPWLTAKLFGLAAYIVCGSLALKRARTKTGRSAFFVLALLIFAYIVSVALTKNPLPYLT